MAYKYVNAITGSDITGDGSQTYPYKTLMKALAAANAGDTVRLMTHAPEGGDPETPGYHTDITPRVQGVVTAAGNGATPYVEDDTKTWTENEWSGFCLWIYGGTGAGQVRRIVGNNSSGRLFLDPEEPWSVIPDGTSLYRLGVFWVANLDNITIEKYSVVEDSGVEVYLKIVDSVGMDDFLFVVEDSGGFTIKGVNLIDLEVSKFLDLRNSANILLEDLEFSGWSAPETIKIVKISGAGSSVDFRRITVKNMTEYNLVESSSSEIMLSGSTLLGDGKIIEGSVSGLTIEDCVFAGAAELNVLDLVQVEDAQISVDLLQMSAGKNMMKIDAGASVVDFTATRILAYDGGRVFDLRGENLTATIHNVTEDGCAVFCRADACSVVVKNSILSNGIACGGIECQPLVTLNGGTITVSYSDIYNNAGENSGPGISYVEMIRYVDPLYKNKDARDYRLSGSSPLVDSGTYVGIPYEGAAPDIGRYEAHPDYDTESLIQWVSQQVASSSADEAALDISGVKEFIKQLLLDELGFVVEPGSAINDLMLDPMAVVFSYYDAALNALSSRQSLRDYENMSGDDLDALVANLFVTRNSGSYSYGTLRLFFLAPVSVSLPLGTEFEAGGHQYWTKQLFSITEEEMSFNVSGDYYYFDVPIYAKDTGASSAVSAATRFTLSTMYIPELVKAEAVEDFTAGVAAESNTELYNRIPAALSNREQGKWESIETIFKETYPAIKHVHCEGFGDPYMMRDMVPGISDHHVGGAIDIYIRTDMVIESYKDISRASKRITLSSSNLTKMPVLKVINIEELDPSTEEPTGVYVDAGKYTVSVLTKRQRFSVNEQILIEFSTAEYDDLPLRIHYYTIENLSTYQDFASSTRSRLLAASVLVKHFWPAFVSMNVRYRAPSDINDLQSLIEEFIRDLQPGEELSASQIVDLCINNGATAVELPYSLSVEQHNADGTIINYTDQDAVVVPEVVHFIPTGITTERIST